MKKKLKPKLYKMKSFIVAVLLFLTFSGAADAQYNHNSKYHYERDTRYGPIILGSGVTFTVACFLTVPDYTWVSTGPSQGHWQKKPFMQQGAKSMCIVTGFTLTFTGLITTLAGR